jgi:hypothetical protein
MQLLIDAKADLTVEDSTHPLLTVVQRVVWTGSPPMLDLLRNCGIALPSRAQIQQAVRDRHRRPAPSRFL